MIPCVASTSGRTAYDSSHLVTRGPRESQNCVQVLLCCVFAVTKSSTPLSISLIHQHAAFSSLPFTLSLPVSQLWRNANLPGCERGAGLWSVYERGMHDMCGNPGRLIHVVSGQYVLLCLVSRCLVRLVLNPRHVHCIATSSLASNKYFALVLH